MHESEIFQAAVKLPPAQRQAFVDAVTTGDSQLQADVKALLREHEQACTFVPNPNDARPASDLFRPLTERPGMSIGPYKLLQQIGEGGFGVVYMAEQQEPVRRKVALKIIKPGMDTREVVARFESERQALALMDHPNIARVLDAGATDSGRPYFVMELVKGVPITEYCDKNNLPTNQRLALFISVCHAVQHAHQKGVIHRDIKPSNVMVTLHDGHPVPKVIDFGVAKATSQRLTERTLFTAYGQMVGTPAYMSPEQAEMSGLDIDTRSDIYSLGVLLYELLTGSTPFDGRRLLSAGFAEMQRIIREEEPPRPSTRISTAGEKLTALSNQRSVDPKLLGQLLRGDLDLIVMKALEKERGRRYDTPNSFADDVERFLRHEVILARPQSSAYRIRKFAQRNKGTVVAGLLIAAALLLGTVVSTGLAVVAHRSRNQAFDATAQARQHLVMANQQRERAEVAQAEALAAAQAERLATQRAEEATAAERSSKDAERAAKESEQSLRQAADEKRQDIERQNAEITALNASLQAEQERQRRMLYTSDMNLVQTAWEADNYSRALELLGAHRPHPGKADLRGFEWFYWNRLCHADLSTVQLLASATTSGWQRNPQIPSELQMPLELQNRQLPVTLDSAAFNADGSQLAGVRGGLFRGITIWNSQSGAELATLPQPGNSSSMPLFDQDGSRLAVHVRRLENANELQMWDIATKKMLFTIQNQGRIELERLQQLLPGNRELWISDDGARLAMAVNLAVGDASQQAAVKFWNARTGDELAVLPLTGPRPGSVTLSPDGSHVASISPTAIATGVAPTAVIQILNVMSPDTPIAIPLAGYASFCFSPDSKRLFVSGVANATQRAEANGGVVFDVASGRRLFSIPLDEPWYKVRFSPDGYWLGVISQGRPRAVKLYPTGGGYAPVEVQGHRSRVVAVAFSGDGQRLFTATVEGQIKTWDLAALTRSEPAQSAPPTILSSPLTAVARDGTRIATAPNPIAPPASADAPAELRSNMVTVRDEAGTVLWQTSEFVGPIQWLAFSADGRHLAACGLALEGDVLNAAQVSVWDIVKGTEQLTVRLPAIENASIGNSIRRSAPGAAFSPSGRHLATTVNLGSRRQGTTAIKVWDLPTGRETWLSKTVPDRLTELMFSPNGERILGVSDSYDARSTVWDAKQGRLLWQTREVCPVGSPGFSVDSTQIFGFSHTSKIIKLWDAGTGQESRYFRVPSFIGAVPDTKTKIALSPDGRKLAAGQSYRESTGVRVWDVDQPERELFTLAGHSGDVQAIAFGPDGRRLAISALGGLVTSVTSGETKLWDAESGQELLTLPGVARNLAFNPDGSVLIGELGSDWGGEIRVRRWDASRLAPSVEVDLIVQSLTKPTGAARLPLMSEILARIDADRALPAQTRAAMLAHVKGLRREQKLIEAGRSIAQLPDLPQESYERAVRYLEEACTSDAADRELWYWRALVHHRAGQWTEALAALARSQELHNAETLSLPAEDLTVLAMTLHQSGKRGEARDILLRARAAYSRDESRWQSLLAEAELLLEIPPAGDNPTLWAGKRVMPRAGARVENAMGDLVRPSVPYTIRDVVRNHLFLAKQQESGGPTLISRSQVVLLEEAVGYYSEYVRAQPENPWGYNHRGVTWQVLGEFDRAIEDYSAAIRLNPNDHGYHQNRGNVWQQEKHDFEKALADYEEAIRLRPREATLHVLRGIVRTKQGELDDALQSFGEAIRLQPELGWAFTRRAYVWSAKGDRAQMLRDLEEGLRLSPDHASTLSSRAWLLATSPNAEHRDGQQAVIAATKACELTYWQDVRDLATLAAAHAEAGEFPQAIKWQEKVVAQLPPGQRANYELPLDLYREGRAYRDTPRQKSAAVISPP